MVTMNFLVILCICAITVNSQDISFKNLPVDLIKSSSPEYFANLILERLDKNNTRIDFGVSQKCIGQLITFALSLLNLKGWALNMFDAHTKLPSGLLLGYGSGLGSFDQCLKVHQETVLTGTIRGRYCLGAIPVVDLTPHPYKNRMINLDDYKINLQWAMCLPDGCTPSEFEKLSILPLKVSTNSCQTAESQTTDFDSEDYSAIVFFALVVVLIVLSTGYEAFNVFFKKSNTWNVFYSFSIITNTLKITSTRKDDEEITCLHGMRAISLLFLTYGFGYATFMVSPVDNLLDLKEWITNQLISVYFEGILVVDTFFLLSGLLVSYKYLIFQSMRIRFNMLWHYVARITRLTPALIAIILLNSTLMRHMGSGPIWPLMKNTLLVNNCRKNWWATLLYLQNYINSNETCLIQSWHLAVDMQLFIISPIFLLLISLGSHIFYISCGVFIFAAAVASFIIGWKYEIKSLFLASLIPEEYSKYMSVVFFAIQTRIPPWTVGMVMGYILFRSRQKSTKEIIRQYFTPLVVLLCWILAIGLFVLCFASPGIIGSDYNWVKNSLHLALMRLVWSISMAWIIFACRNGFSGPINRILSAPICQIISRISYGTFLTNITAIIYVSLQTRKGIEFSHVNAFHKFWLYSTYTLAIGFIWTLAFVSPIVQLQKAFLPTVLKFTNSLGTFQDLLFKQFKEKKGPTSISTKL